MFYKIFLSLYFILSISEPAAAKELMQLSGLIHVHSRFSSGRDSIEELAVKARKNNIDVLVITDHDLIRMEYGVLPFRNILKLTVNRGSVIKSGVEKYLNEIRRVNDKYKDVVLIPGVESSPFYYWTGSPLKGNLTAHNWRKHIHAIGLYNPKDYFGLPVIHNSYSTRYIYHFLPGSIFFVFSAFFAIFLVRWKGLYRISGIAILAVSLLGIANKHPFRSSLFDQYKGDQQERPYQEFIDYVNEKGGLTFWAHPESNLTEEIHNGIGMKTPKYTMDILSTGGYTGFEAVYEDTIHFTAPGNGWDKILVEYCNNTRGSPAWGIGGLDYHGEGENEGNKFGGVMTIFMAEKKDKQSILESLRQGKIYSLRRSGDYRLNLDEFVINDNGIAGDEIVSKGDVKIKFKITYTDGKDRKISVRLVRSGKIIETFSGKTPYTAVYHDTIGKNGEKFYYRLLVNGNSPHYIISNPVFVRRYKREM